MSIFKSRGEKKLAEEYCWVITRAAGGHIAGYLVPVRWCPDFNCTPPYIRLHTQLTTFYLRPNFRYISIAHARRACTAIN